MDGWRPVRCEPCAPTGSGHWPLSVRVPRRRLWWAGISGLGAAGARRIESFFKANPDLTERARALVHLDTHGEVVPQEQLLVPAAVDGSRGAFRGPVEKCTLSAHTEYDAVNAWLSVHEFQATQRAYRKEAERVILWAVLERWRALSSLTAEDAIAYRAFLRRPAPRSRWVGPARPRMASDWRPFAGDLSPRSVAYALSVVGALYPSVGHASRTQDCQRTAKSRPVTPAATAVAALITEQLRQLVTSKTWPARWIGA